MKRFHVNVAVASLSQSIKFYSILFGESPTVSKKDYAKWMLDDPSINFLINESSHRRGVNHLGMQVESTDELEAIQKRLHWAGQEAFDQPDAECCYANRVKPGCGIRTTLPGKRSSHTRIFRTTVPMVCRKVPYPRQRHPGAVIRNQGICVVNKAGNGHYRRGRHRCQTQESGTAAILG